MTSVKKVGDWKNDDFPKVNPFEKEGAESWTHRRSKNIVAVYRDQDDYWVLAQDEFLGTVVLAGAETKQGIIAKAKKWMRENKEGRKWNHPELRETVESLRD